MNKWAEEEEFEVKGSADADDGTPKKARINATKQVCFPIGYCTWKLVPISRVLGIHLLYSELKAGLFLWLLYGEISC